MIAPNRNKPRWPVSAREEHDSERHIAILPLQGQLGEKLGAKGKERKYGTAFGSWRGPAWDTTRRIRRLGHDSLQVMHDLQGDTERQQAVPRG